MEMLLLFKIEREEEEEILNGSQLPGRDQANEGQKVPRAFRNREVISDLVKVNVWAVWRVPDSNSFWSVT